MDIETHSPAATVDTPPHRYSATLAREIEARWQDWWDEHHTFETPNPAGPLADPSATAQRGEKLFVLDMFPYPSGVGLHVGHPLGFIGTDVYGRFKRMTRLQRAAHDGLRRLRAARRAVRGRDRHTPGDHHRTQRRQLPPPAAPARADPRSPPQRLDHRPDVLPLDAVDLPPDLQRLVRHRGSSSGPADRRADRRVRVGRPAHARRPAVGRLSRRASGPTSIDDHRLAYVSDAPVNWCPGLGTVVANEEVTADGRSDRGNFPVFKRNMRQWMMRITAYADRLIDDLDLLDWTDAIKTMQRNWIGRSDGARVHFDSPAGADHRVHHPARHAVRRDVPGARARASAGRRSDHARTAPTRSPCTASRRRRRRTFERQDETREKTGVFTGSYAINPVNGEDDPDLDRRLRADGLRHRRDHGGAVRRPARLRVRPQVRPADPGDPAAAGRVVRGAGHRPDARHATWPDAFVGDAPYVNSANVTLDLNGIDNKADGIAATNAWLEANGAGHGDDHLQAARLAVQPPALLGRAVPDRLRRRRQPARPARSTCCRSCCPRPTRSRRARSTPTTSSPTRRARSTG